MHHLIFRLSWIGKMADVVKGKNSQRFIVCGDNRLIIIKIKLWALEIDDFYPKIAMCQLSHFIN